ncbi:MAG: GTPase Era [Deltaproteobacteria bacterium]|nr:GTPase Era [Deltaproteobacteria bacterium]
MSFKSGFVALIGPPNSGKSTLLNNILGWKLAITSPKPQTTRNRILGVRTTPEYQAIFLDTPGMHRSNNPLNQALVTVAVEALAEVDLAVVVMDVFYHRGDALEAVIANLKKVNTPVILALNKVDLVKKQELLPMLEDLATRRPWEAVVPISALTGLQVDDLLQEVAGLLPEGPQYYPEDMDTDQTERFIVSELIREQVFLKTFDEIPYSAAVVIESFREDEQKGMIFIEAVIQVERESQKGIVIGKQGQKLKTIGQAARKGIETLLGSRVYLGLHVKVAKNWASDPRALKRLITDSQKPGS